MAEKSYADREVIDKLGLRAGMRVHVEGSVPHELLERVRALDDVTIVAPDDEEPVHVALVRLSSLSEAKPVLARLRKRIVPVGAIWVLTAKKSQPDYVRQEALIPLGKAVGLIDNKIARIDDATSAIRFVIPIAQRERPKPTFG